MARNRQTMIAELRNQVRRDLYESLGVGERNPYYGGSTNVMDPLGMSAPSAGWAQRKMGGVTIPRGTTPSEADVDRVFAARYPELAGQTRGRVRGGQGGAKAANNAVGRGGKIGAAQGDMLTGNAMIDQIIKEHMAGKKEAKDANLARYDEVKKLYEGVATKNMEGIGNAYKAQEQLNAEKARETLGSVNAGLAAKGLFNSTSPEAFRQRIDRNLALEQQDLAERRGELERRYRSTDTERLGGFIERRTDVGPEDSLVMSLLQTLGRTGNGQGSSQVQAQIDQLRSEADRLRNGGGYWPQKKGPLGGVPFVDLFGMGGGGQQQQQPYYDPQWQQMVAYQQQAAPQVTQQQAPPPDRRPGGVAMPVFQAGAAPQRSYRYDPATRKHYVNGVAFSEEQYQQARRNSRVGF